MDLPLELLAYLDRRINEEHQKYENRVRQLQNETCQLYREAYSRYIHRINPLKRQRRWIADQVKKSKADKPPQVLISLPEPDNETKVQPLLRG